MDNVAVDPEYVEVYVRKVVLDKGFGFLVDSVVFRKVVTKPVNEFVEVSKRLLEFVNEYHINALRRKYQ